MKIEHGTYTEAHKAVNSVLYPGIFSKIYTNDIDAGTTVTFMDANGDDIDVICGPGSILPLVTKMATWPVGANGSIIALR